MGYNVVSLCQVEVRLRGALKFLIVVERQLRSDTLFLQLHCQAVSIQNQIHRLLGSGLVDQDTVVIDIPEHGQVQYALFGVDVRDICYPFVVGSTRMKISVEQILILVKLLSHLPPFPPAADF